MGYDQKKCQALADLISTADLTDIFRFKYPQKREYTFYRPRCAASRLDKFYISKNLLLDVNSVNHVASLSDHCGVKMGIV